MTPPVECLSWQNGIAKNAQSSIHKGPFGYSKISPGIIPTDETYTNLASIPARNFSRWAFQMKRTRPK
jgi:hypothetical protein